MWATGKYSSPLAVDWMMICRLAMPYMGIRSLPVRNTGEKGKQHYWLPTERRAGLRSPAREGDEVRHLVAHVRSTLYVLTHIALIHVHS